MSADLIDPWIATTRVSGDPRLAGVDLTSVDLVAVVAEASDLLYEWSGHRYGTATVTVNGPTLTWDEWSRICWGDRTRLRLARPVQSVTSVVALGVGAGAWFVEDREALVRVDGGMWPRDTTVTYVRGTPPNALAQDAAVELAVELVNARLGLKCRLPASTTAVVRQGVSIKAAGRNFLVDGRVGLPLVDLFLAAKNPNRLRRRPSIMSPDTIRTTRRT